jgi:hypothetical protein
LILLAVFAIHGLAQTGSFDRTLQVSGPVNLDISSGSGTVTVRTGTNESVHVVARMHAGNSWLDWLDWFGMSTTDEIHKLESNPPIEQQGNSIRVGHIEGWQLHNISIDYDVTAPSQTALVSHTGSGDQSISGLKLPSAATAGSGSITIENIDADVRLRTGSGDLKITSVKSLNAEVGSGSIPATQVAGEVVATTGSGSIEIEQVAGNARIGTGSGDVTLHGAKGAVRVETGSGEVHVEGEPTSDWHISTASGSIGLKLPSKASFDLDARTVSGSVKMDRAITVTGLVSRNHLQGKVGTGGALLDAHAASGNVEID